MRTHILVANRHYNGPVGRLEGLVVGKNRVRPLLGRGRIRRPGLACAEPSARVGLAGALPPNQGGGYGARLAPT